MTAVSSVQLSQANPFHRLGFSLLLLYLFLSVSRVLDVSFWHLKIPLVTFLLMAVCLLLSGSAFRAFRSRITLRILAFAVWVALAGFFGIWRSASIKPVVGSVLSFGIFLAIMGFVNTPARSLRIMHTLAYAALTGALLSFIFSTGSGYRQAVAQGSFADPNEFAMTLLMGLPFWWLIARNAQAPVKKMLAFSCMLPVLVAILRSGSRGGFIALLCMCTMLFVTAPPARKLLILAAGLLLAVISQLFLTDYLKARYVTFFTVQANEVADPSMRERLQGEAVNSTAGRLALLFASIRVTAEHPLLGVGPNNFPLANWEYLKSHDWGNSWAVSHNSYTQVSSETGIPGFLLFCLILWSGFRVINSILKPRATGAPPLPPHLAHAALYLKLSLTVVAVCGAFLSFAYTGVFQLLIGIALALQLSLAEETKERTAAAVPARI